MKNYQKNSSLNWWDLKSLLIMVIQKGNVHFKIIRRKKTTKKGYDKFETDGSRIVCCIDIVNELMELVFGKE